MAHPMPHLRSERIDAFLPLLDELITEGLVVREDIDIVAYRGRDEN